MENTQNWKDLWLKNYNNQGDCEGLEKFTRTLDFGAKKMRFICLGQLVKEFSNCKTVRLNC